MKVAYYPKILTNKKSNVLVGTFDGFHYGHLKLLEKAKSLNQRIGIILFKNPHYLSKNINNKFYLDFETKLQNIANLGIDFCSIINYDHNFKTISGKDFLLSLKKIFNYNKIICGKDFKFGFQKKSSPRDFINDFIIIDTFKINNNKISTSLLKKLVEIGEFKTIRQISTNAYKIIITFNKNKNFIYNQFQVKPQCGIFSGYFIINEVKYFAFIRIGFIDNEIVIPDLKINNSDFKTITGTFCFYDVVRIIINKEQDIIKKNDCEKSLILILKEKKVI